MIIGLIIAVIVLFVLFFMASTYTVVKPNEAHIVVFMGRGRKIYSPSVVGDKKLPTAYFKLPVLMEVDILPLANVKMELPGFQLVDQEVAPFACEVTCWFRIQSPDIAIEKLEIRESFANSVRSILEEQVRGVARAAAMKQPILEIMRDRKSFGASVENEVNGALVEWGLELVKLEIVDFSDSEGSTVIQDYENKRKSQIRSESRMEVAVQTKEAEIAEAQAAEESGVALANSTQEVEKANVEKNKQVNISKQKAAQEIAKAAMAANTQTIDAEKELEVGRSEYEREAKVVNAQGEKSKAILVGEGEAQAARVKGQADADIVEIRGTAEAKSQEAQGLAKAKITKEQGLSEATATDKKAEALKKYNAAGINLEKIKATVEVEKKKYEALGQALSQADIQLINGGETNLFGMALGPEQGAGFAAALQAFESVSGVDPVKAVVDVVKKKQ